MVLRLLEGAESTIAKIGWRLDWALWGQLLS